MSSVAEEASEVFLVRPRTCAKSARNGQISAQSLNGIVLIDDQLPEPHSGQRSFSKACSTRQAFGVERIPLGFSNVSHLSPSRFVLATAHHAAWEAAREWPEFAKVFWGVHRVVVCMDRAPGAQKNPPTFKGYDLQSKLELCCQFLAVNTRPHKKSKKREPWPRIKQVVNHWQNCVSLAMPEKREGNEDFLKPRKRRKGWQQQQRIKRQNEEERLSTTENSRLMAGTLPMQSVLPSSISARHWAKGLVRERGGLSPCASRSKRLVSRSAAHNRIVRFGVRLRRTGESTSRDRRSSFPPGRRSFSNQACNARLKLACERARRR